MKFSSLLLACSIFSIILPSSLNPAPIIGIPENVDNLLKIYNRIWLIEDFTLLQTVKAIVFDIFTASDQSTVTELIKQSNEGQNNFVTFILYVWFFPNGLENDQLVRIFFETLDGTTVFRKLLQVDLVSKRLWINRKKIPFFRSLLKILERRKDYCLLELFECIDEVRL
jgi:hypothetical protein